jgi:class 3 adenylate cyclase
MNMHTPLNNNKQAVVAYYLASALVMALYLVISLQAETFTAIFSVTGAFGLCLAAMAAISGSRRPDWKSGDSILKNQQRQIDFDLSLFLITAASVSLLETYLLDSGAALAVKTFAVVLSAGIYTSLGIALELEYANIKNNVIVNITRLTQIIPGKFKLRQFLALLLATGLANFGLALYDFMTGDYAVPAMSQYAWERSFQEIVFIATAVLGVSIYLLYLYIRNLFQVLGMQVNILRRVEEGCYDVSMPVVSEDESGLLANYHNFMIERLRDRERLYRTLKKSVGSNIMAKLLNTDEEKLKHGEAHNVAILFCDLRGFSSLGESASAEEIILFLNVYFAEVSAVISRHDGIINKFMGDAVLAIFGLEGKENAAEQAVNAGLEIIEHSADISMPNDMHPQTGVGIHFGPVAAGTIGSEERYEYTVVGDAVNKASRLESLSKRLDYSLILSKDAYERLEGDTMREKFVDLGPHPVRGMSEPIHVYGAWKKAATDQIR